MSLPQTIPKDLSDLLRRVATDFPGILRENLVGIYLWGSLTYDAFDETCSDVDCIAVTSQDLDKREFSELDIWFTNTAAYNHWVKRLDMRFVIDHQFLDKTSRCCGFYQHAPKLARHGSDGNPIIWMNIGQSGITLWGKDAKLIAPQISDQCFNDALLLELNYLKEGLASNVGHRSSAALAYNAYAVLTSCRILYSAHHRTLASKNQAAAWAIETKHRPWPSVIRAARENRLNKNGSTTRQLEENAQRFVELAVREVLAHIRPCDR
jgi:hypothetical protein